MIKYLLPLLILSTLISCNRKSEFKSVELGDFEDISNALSSTKSEPKESKASFPLLQIHPKSSTLKILNSNDELVSELAIKVTPSSFVRKKLLSLIKDRYSERVTLDDLFKVSFSLSSSESFKILNKYKFSDLNNLRGVISSTSYIKYENSGLLTYLNYRSGIENNNEFFSDFELENSDDQTEGFEYGAKPNEAYEFKLPPLVLKDLFKNITKNNEIVYSLEEFSLENTSVTNWKTEILEKGSVLIISEEDSQKSLFIANNTSVEDTLKKNNIALSSISSHKKINFIKFNEKIARGEVIALVNDQSEFDLSEKVFSEYQNVKEIRFTKIKNKNAHLYIQLKGINHKLIHWYKPERLLSLTNGSGFHHRSCNVSRRKVEKSAITLVPKKEKLSFSINYNGINRSIDSLIKSGDIKVELNENSLHFILLDLPGMSDRTEVLFQINSTLALTNIAQDKGQCVLKYSSRTYDVEGAYETVIREEVFESFKPSSRKQMVGIEKSMNIITVL
ncbi:hypothetical protein [Halobacteriovorax sp.]|uniref:hypothetical protein n=1 Tax=Halobacteriovorax sp. TaxID=2020862 RepID=UPI0035646BF5